MAKRIDVDTKAIRDRLGELLDQVRYRGDELVVHRRGKPMVAIIPYEAYERIREHREQSLQVLRKLWAANDRADPAQVEADVRDAVRETRGNRRRTTG